MFAFSILAVGFVRSQEHPGRTGLDSLLRDIYRKDQGIRQQDPTVLASGNLDSILLQVRQMEAVDAENQKAIEKILRDGWPVNLSDTANKAIFLVIDHADLEFQKQYLGLVKEAADAGSLHVSDWATLNDRILMEENKMQVYGTQTKTFMKFPEETSVSYLWPVEDADNLDARRKEIGLPPVEDYLSLVKAYTGLEIIWDKTLTVEDILREQNQKQE